MKACASVLLALAVVAAMLQTPARTEQRTDASASGEDVNVRYARAYLRLAKANLESVLAANRSVAELHSAVAVERLRADVKIAEELLRQALPSGSGNLHQVHIQSAKSDQAIAELNLRNAIALNKRVPGTVSEVELEKIRSAAEVARLGVERARDKANSESELAHTQWQLEQLREAMLELRVHLDRIDRRTR